MASRLTLYSDESHDKEQTAPDNTVPTLRRHDIKGKCVAGHQGGSGGTEKTRNDGCGVSKAGQARNKNANFFTLISL